MSRVTAICFSLQRILIPAVLVIAALIRPVGISYIYMLMFFIAPFVPIATHKKRRRPINANLFILLTISVIILLTHLILQLLIIFHDLKNDFGACSLTEQIFRHIGFIDFRNVGVLAIIEWLSPEVLVFLTSIIVFIIIKQLTAKTDHTLVENGDVVPSEGNPEVSSTIQQGLGRITQISPVFCMTTLFFSAILRPSVPGGFYFLIFLICGTYWATYRSLLSRGFAMLMRLMLVVLALHILLFVGYQTPWLQQTIPQDSLLARLLGLEPLIISSCEKDIRFIIYNLDLNIVSFINPIVMFFSYYAIALTSRNILKKNMLQNVAKASDATDFGPVQQQQQQPQQLQRLQQPHPLQLQPQQQLQLENGSKKLTRQFSLVTQPSRGSKKDNWTKTQRLSVSLRRPENRPQITLEPTETTPLMRANLKKQGSRLSGENSRVIGDADIPLDTIQSQEAEERSNVGHEDNSSIFEHFWYGIVSVGGFIYQNSYIFTNILMMTWAIVYHSWLTFVLLLWANLLWMIPNQRASMMRSSPLVTLYAELLVVAQYIYGMNLNNNELPTKVDITGINLAQIGFERPQEHDTQPCVPLIVKTLFLLMFWVTLRQFSKEKKYRKMGQKLSHISFSSSKYESKKTSKFLKQAGSVIKNLLVRLWMWLLVLVIFLCAISGKQMTGFRICYMGLFLFFLLVFQSSSQAWIKIMYGFWLFLIFYSMSILILIYTYQFDKFDQYWNDYLNISKTLQTDIGLLRYKTKDLFLHLVSPTVIVILTVIQVHYFHKRFITALEHRTIQDRGTNLQRIRSASFMRASRKSYRLSESDFQQSFMDLMRHGLKKMKANSKYLFVNTKKLFWRLMELHAIKLVYLFAFLCCVSEVCLLHIILVALCLIGVMARSFLHIFISRVISLVVTVIVIIRMIYQIAYLDHNRYNVTCDSNNQTVYNNAFWFGVAKASKETGNLIGLLKMHIIYMMMVTLHAVVTLRHQKSRDQRSNEAYFKKVLFPGITRADAEKNFKGMIKFLCNYGFYKFGLEISLIMLVCNIAFRRDIVALIYVSWLIIFILCDRTKCSRIWIIYQWFLVSSIMIQYIILVGLPPSLCLNYPWTNSSFAEKIQRWAMLPGNYSYNHLPKLIFDFIVLYIAKRQHRVFVIEKHYEQHNIAYPGGSNNNVVSDIAKLGVEPFVNPTRDFLTNIRNYLDICKNIVLCSFYWVTLAVVFYAGTCITDFLALGYLIGAFIFLWQGSDFFLLPINTIIKRWQYLLAFNVGSIAVKTALQMAGCLFFKELTENCCWLVHIFGITCAISRTSTQVDEFDAFTSEECPAPTKQVVLLWDAICFAFILLQLRIFKSYYFCHIIADAKANSLLASRGAEIIEDLRQKQIAHRHEHEILVLHKIKRKMEKIRATQQKIKPADKTTHFDDADEGVVIKMAPLARHSSFSSCQGSDYCTPDDADADADAEDDVVEEDESQHSVCTTDSSRADTNSSEDRAQLIDSPIPKHRIHIQNVDDYDSDAQTDFADVHSLSEGSNNVSPRAGIKRLKIPMGSLQTKPQQLSPSSDMLTLPLDGFLDTKRISLGSTVYSDLIAPQADNVSMESNEVFAPSTSYSAQPTNMRKLLAPPPVGGLTSCSLAVNVSGASSVISSNVTTNGGMTGRHRRQSSINAVSWNETVSIKCPTEENLLAAEESDDLPVTLRQKSLHRRHLSVGNASYSMGEGVRRRYSNISGVRDETYLQSATRPQSWGPVEYGNQIPGPRAHKRQTHPEAVRAGDYYMFEDMDKKFELDLIEDEVDFLDDQDNMTPGEKRINRRKALYDVWKDIHAVDYRHQLYVRQLSCVSAPGSRIGIKVDEELDVKGGIGVRTSTLSEPLDLACCSTSEQFIRLVKVPSNDLEMKEQDQDQDQEQDQDDQSFYKDLEPEESSTVIRPSTSKEGASTSSATDETKKTRGPVELTEKESDDDLEGNPIVRLLEGFLVSLSLRLNRFSRNYRYVNKILTEEKKAVKESPSLYQARGSAVIQLIKKLDRDDKDEPPSSFTARSAQNNQNISPQYQTNTTTPQNTPPITNTNTNTTTNSTNQTLDSDSQTQSQPNLQDQSSQSSNITHDNQNSQESQTTLSSREIQASQAGQDSRTSKTSKASQPQNPDAIIEIPVDTVDTTKHRSELQSNLASARRRKLAGLPEIRIRAPSFDRSYNGSGYISRHRSCECVDSHADFAFEDEDFITRDHHVVIEVLISAWYALLANTDLICYIVIFINQVVNASVIALPIPLMVFLWGTLSLPRPTKTFWVTLIGYTELVVLIKCVFQYKLIWANYTSIGQPLAPAKIIGVQWNPNYATYDLMVLLALFFHRFILKSQGLWKSDYELSTKPANSPPHERNRAGVEESPTEPTGSISLPSRVRNATKKILIISKSRDEAMSLQGVDGNEQHDRDSTNSPHSSVQIKRSKYFSSSGTFFYSLLHKSRLPTDVYALMFLCDFINFFVLLFGFTAFGAQQPEGGGGVQKYLSEDKVPIPFLIMLLIQFILIVIDRALYLRKALFYKIIFHFLSVIGIHIWMFFVVPAVTERSFYASAPPVIFYIIKCFYMLLSSYQIKCGYPKRILGNFLTKNFSLVNMITFKVYMLVPFLYELRTILDWVSIDTTMTLFDWLKMEDIFSDIFFIKCSRQMESDFPAMRAEKKPLFNKLLMGGTIILIIVISIWGPLCLFALGNAVGQPNVPSEVSVNIRIGSYDPIYSSNSRESIYTFNHEMFSDMQSTYIRQKGALTFLNSYDAEDIAVVKLASNSPSMWNISPPDRDRLLDELEAGSTLKVRLTYSFTRIPVAKAASGVSTEEVTFDIGPEFKDKEQLIKMLKGTASPTDVVVIPKMVPKFIKVLNNGGPSIVHVLMPPEHLYRPLILKMHAPSEDSIWWEIMDFTDDEFYTNTLSKLPMAKEKAGVLMYTFNDKKFPSTFSFLTASGIIGLYTTFVLLASRLLKSFMSGLNRHIMFEDLPYVDRVLQLCLDIYLVREAHEFALEEDLFAKLLFLYRSPETMIKWTRPKEETAEDETDTESMRSRSSARRHENPQ